MGKCGNASEGEPFRRPAVLTPTEKVERMDPHGLRPWSPFLLRVVVREGLDGDD